MFSCRTVWVKKAPVVRLERWAGDFLGSMCNKESEAGKTSSRPQIQGYDGLLLPIVLALATDPESTLELACDNEESAGVEFFGT